MPLNVRSANLAFRNPRSRSVLAGWLKRDHSSGGMRNNPLHLQHPHVAASTLARGPPRFARVNSRLGHNDRPDVVRSVILALLQDPVESLRDRVDLIVVSHVGKTEQFGCEGT